ncbi:MAG TPA: DUF2059 domain-containing protein [Thermoanaerobaculia bacterium]|jgi:hypothetical protein|nr:DUF2059 domain-containing protein [Thermoanaerobaculia bacterium]
MKNVKRVVVVLALFVTASALADARTEKRQLIAELLEAMDAKGMTQASFDAVFATMRAMTQRTSAEEMPAEYREQWEAERKKEDAELNKFREQLFTRVDYVKYAEQSYVPLFDEHFSSDELKELLAFFKTKAGQKLAALIPKIGVGGVAEGQSILMKAANDTAEQIEKEENAKTPWRPTMADLRTIATALEARATDTNDYPVVSFENLEGLLAPTYIRGVPKVDAWGTPFVYVGDGTHYRVVSAGADRRFEWGARQLDLSGTAPRESNNLDADIIFQDGIFTQYPPESGLKPEP